jgi:hypothetical protein
MAGNVKLNGVAARVSKQSREERSLVLLVHGPHLSGNGLGSSCLYEV